MPQKPKILDVRTIARTRVFCIEQLKLRFSNGVEAQYERLQSPVGAVMIVPMLDNDIVLLVREYAAGLGRYEIALPKGRIEDGENVLDAANREMMEEIGYGAKQLRQLRSLSLAPSYADHVTHVVTAQGLYQHRLPGDEPEELEVVPWRLSELEQLLAREDFSEARSIAALFMVREQNLRAS